MSTIRVGTKRRRMSTPVVVQTSQKRPIDKNIVNVAQVYVASSAQVQTILKTTSFPCTITGIRWEMTMDNNGATVAQLTWAIVILRDGVVAGTISFSDAGSMYKPEQNVLAWGHGISTVNTSTAGPETRFWNDTTKTMRKLQEGDQIVMISKTSGVWTGSFTGTVQFFCKS